MTSSHVCGRNSRVTKHCIFLSADGHSGPGEEVGLLIRELKLSTESLMNILAVLLVLIFDECA